MVSIVFNTVDTEKVSASYNAGVLKDSSPSSILSCQFPSLTLRAENWELRTGETWLFVERS